MISLFSSPSGEKTKCYETDTADQKKGGNPVPVFRRLDDQTYEDIVEQAKGRLPWLCPAWTDHNAHDPGITLLELMAWYKELQQYHLDRLTPSLCRCLLKLAGVTPRHERDAVLPLMVGQECPPRLPDDRLTNAQDIIFELSEPIPARRSTLKAVAAEEAGVFFDITSMLYSIPSFHPFCFAGRNDTVLCLGFDQKPQDALRLWFDVVPPAGSTRNPPGEDSQPPRALEWQLEGCGRVLPLEDETWNLSWSGRVTLPAPQEWSAGRDGLYWLRLRQTAPGCEENVRLSRIYDALYRARQRESCAREHRFRIEDQPEQRVLLRSSQAKDAMLAVFLRTDRGLEQTSAYQERWIAGEGRELTVDGSGASRDGAENLLVACLDSLRAQSLLFDAKGIPGERFTLEPGGQKPLTEHLRLMCMTLETDGVVRPAPWTLVDDLSLCSPRDRVFAYDAARECLVFGDGEHGATVAPGPGAVMVTELILSHCGAGNIPEDAGLWFEADGMPVLNGPAEGGRDAETLEACRSRLLQRLEKTLKCESAADYANCAMQTPGLRVAGAKALPGFDSRLGAETRRAAFVTVVVLPASESPRPMPDAHFLAEVERQLERYRPICICTRASAPRYVPLSISVELETTGEADEPAIRAQLMQWLAPCAERVGQGVRRSDAVALLQKLPGVQRIRKAEVRGLDQNSYLTKTGDLLIPQDALPALERIEVEMLRI